MALSLAWRKHLGVRTFELSPQRDIPVQLGICGSGHLAHAALAELLSDAVMGDRLTNHQSSVRVVLILKC